jgi:hypothetical protein
VAELRQFSLSHFFGHTHSLGICKGGFTVRFRVDIELKELVCAFASKIDVKINGFAAVGQLLEADFDRRFRSLGRGRFHKRLWFDSEYKVTKNIWICYYIGNQKRTK